MVATLRRNIVARVIFALSLLAGMLGAAPIPSVNASTNSAALLTATPTFSYQPLFLSLTENQTIGGVVSADEDILKFDGQTWSLFFDGSDVGGGSADLFAVAMLDADSILIAFNTSVTLGGIAFAPQDIIRFDASSLGNATAGTFSMYFDGSDVGLTTAAESLDAVSLLSDGRVLISTTGNPSVTGISGDDEDVLAFTPTSLGSTTAGSWSLYFDGSDVGLADNRDEDIDALDVAPDGRIYLSTVDNFAVSGVAGANEDVFICAPTSIGSTTACSYSSNLYFDGSTWALSANDVDAFHFLASLPTPTASPTSTATASPNPASTSTLTSSPTASRTSTATAAASPAFTFTASATSTLTTTAVPATATVTQTSTPTFAPTSSATLDATATKLQASTSTSAPTATASQTATSLPTPTHTPEPTSTLIPTATFTPIPSATDTSTLPATETPEPTFTPLPTFTTNPTASATSTSSVPAMGPLTLSALNPRYFADPSGQVVLLTGSHTWCNFMDCDDTAAVTAKFNYTAYLDFLEANNHNFFRLWRAENSRGGEAGPNFWFDPMPYARSTTCCAFDGGNKFDVTQFNQAYFDRMRERVLQARERGMYVSIMLFDGWSVESKFGGHEPWTGHPYNANNNVNNIDGDLNHDNQGGETHTLASPAITVLQEAYVRKVIDTVNDLDNVLYEVSNESPANSEGWQYHMVNIVRSYEATKPYSHPIGVTWEWPGGDNSDLYNSPADWISLGGGVDLNTYVPPAADGGKVILADTDHLCGICGNRQWVWKSFTRGENPIFMDSYDNATSGRGIPFSNAAEPEIRLNMGYVKSYAEHINLAAMIPQPALCSTGYCLVHASASDAEYLAFLPGGGSISVDLSVTQSTLAVEWLNLSTGAKVNDGTVNGGAMRQFTAPFGGDAVLYLYTVVTATPTPSPLPSATVIPTFTLTAILPTGTPSLTNTAVLSTSTVSPTATLTPTRTPTMTPAGSFPRTTVLDTFNRSNGAVGSNWSGYSSAFRIASNQLDVTASGWNTYMMWNSTSFGTDQEAFVTLAQLDAGSGNEHSLVLKSQSSSTNNGLLYIQYDAVGHTVQVWTYHPSQNWVQHGANIAATFVSGDQLGARARSNGTVEIYKNGTLIATRSVTSWPYYANGGYIGVWFVNATGALADNFGGGTLP